MAFKLFNDDTNDDVFFNIEENDGTIALVATKKGGVFYDVIKIMKDGRLRLSGSVPKSLGFDLTEGGYIKTYEE